MFIHASEVRNREVVRQALLQAAPEAEVWQADSGALLIGEQPETDDWRLVGTAQEYLRDISAEAR